MVLQFTKYMCIKVTKYIIVLQAYIYIYLFIYLFTHTHRIIH